MASWNNRGRGSSEEMLDHENQRLTDQLAGKVSLLKNYAFDMERETREGNRYLDNLEGDFDSSSGLLSGSMVRIQNMMGTGKNNRKLMCYVILGLVGLFFIAYFLITHITAGSST